MNDTMRKIEIMYKDLMNTYFKKRNATKILEYLHEEVKSIGSGEHETSYNKEEFYKRLNEKLILEPEPFQVDYKNIQINKVDETSYLLYSDFILSQKKERKNTSKKMRQSLVFRKINRKFKIIAMHTSATLLLSEYDDAEDLENSYSKVIKGEEFNMATNVDILKYLPIVAYNIYSNIVVLNYKYYRYEFVQMNDTNFTDFPPFGEIKDFTKKLYEICSKESFVFINAIQNYDILQYQFHNKNKLIYETKRMQPTGEVWFEHTIIPVQKEENETLYFILTQDINDKKLKEESLKNQIRAADSAGKAKEGFLTYMSHEIRTPLNGIKGMLDLLMEQPEFKQNRYIRNASISASHLSKIVNDILDVSKIEHGKLDFDVKLFFIEDLIEEIDAILQPLAEEKGIRLLHNYFKSQYNAIMIDESRVKQILINLLMNSIRYTNPGGRVNFDIITEKIRENLLSVFFIIEDSGIGMSEEFLKSAFVPYEQEENKYSRMGTGLGLTITKLLVELMGGSIRCESKKDIGTKITLHFIMEATNEIKKRDTMKSSLEEEEELNFSGKRVLIVEDNELNMEIAAINLQLMGFAIEKAYDGEKAIQMFRKSKEGYYDIIFMDIMMPKKDGLQATMEIRQMDREDAYSIPIIAMTANAFIEDINRALESGMNYHLSKPFDKIRIQNLLKKIFSYIGNPSEFPM